MQKSLFIFLWPTGWLGLLAPGHPDCLQEKLDFQDNGDANVSDLRGPAEVAKHQIPIKALGSVNGNTVEILANLSALQLGNWGIWDINMVFQKI